MNGTTTQTKGQHPADGSPRWTVVGTAGRVVYDILGNHLALIPTYGEIDSIMGKTLARVREYAQLGDDDALFAVLVDLYSNELEFQAIVEASYTHRRCQHCGATQGLKMLFGPFSTPAGYECADGCTGGAR